MNTRRLMQAGLMTALVVPLLAQSAQGPAEAPALPSGDFFIISSIDLGRKQILLKRPTEVTELMRMADGILYFDGQGKRIRLADLRAGDTVYIELKPGETSVAVTIRKGPMTLEVLHERYLKGKK